MLIEQTESIKATIDKLASLCETQEAELQEDIANPAPIVKTIKTKLCFNRFILPF